MKQPRKTTTDISPFRASKGSFALKATLKGLALLCGILVAVNGINKELKTTREAQDIPKRLITEEEAAIALRVHKNTVRKWPKTGVLVFGIHFVEYEATILYHFDIARLFVEKPGKVPEQDLPSTNEEKNREPKKSPINRDY